LKPEKFRSFGRAESGESVALYPRHSADVQKIFVEAAASKRQVAVRGGGHSFDGQALHDGDNGRHIVMLTSHLKGIEFKPGNKVTVGAGDSWSTILRESIARGLVPAIIQTAGCATAGGTLAGDCLSRFSGALGKESEWIDSFTLVPPAGDPLFCSRQENPEAFHAAIGGHGYLGVATDITYQLLALPRGCGVRTNITTFRSLKKLVEAQIPVAKRAAHLAKSARSVLSDVRSGTSAAELRVSSDIRAVSSVAFESLGGVKGAVFESFYEVPKEPRFPPFPLYNDLESGYRYAAEMMVRNDLLNRVFHEGLFLLLESGENRFHDDIAEFSFFMDGNTFAKRKFEARHPKKVFPITQQTFVVPADQIVRFANRCLTLMKKHGVTPTELDILFVLADECLMSATYQKSGFALSLAFENYSTASPPAKVDSLLRELTVVCGKAGGRIHLVKSLRADKAVVQSMFQGSIQQFKAIKSRLDPKCTLRNSFFDKIFDC
jgi:decaprenylphospho-beta-D-ribofuranose 2-oxidase